MTKAFVIAVLAGIVVLAGIYVALDRMHPASTADTAGGSDAKDGGGDFMKSFIASFRGSCTNSAAAALAQKGVDPKTKENAEKIETYCSCATDRVGSELSVRELLVLKVYPSSEPAASKMKNIIQECGAKVANFGQ